MPRIKRTRQQLFDAALALEGISLTQFSATIPPKGRTANYVRRVARGLRDAPQIRKAIDDFIRKHFPDEAIAA